MFGFAKTENPPQGMIAYYGLQDWWLTEFSAAEREAIHQRYKPMGSHSNNLTDGVIESTTQSVVGYLATLASWMSREAERPIARKILAKCEQLMDEHTPILARHFFFQHKLELYYRDREEGDNLETAIRACMAQIRLGPDAANAFLESYPTALPSHRGYEQLAIILEKQKMFDKAIVLCEQARDAGWAGDWDKRIARCRKKSTNK